MDEDELIGEAMRLVRARRDPERVAAAARANGARHVMTDATRQKLREAQQERREREREAGLIGPKAAPPSGRPRGRPKKAETEN